mmetsp:Transcript_38594/g.84278  ORF Transcript_38594/g.84278 Transcript_38594/m.84278 type:complete len:168 (+) Transcript_38594:55-558(+)|eukprot:CAMPEP_0204318462 /NCGR_PEP_ID=MMETSP0469-20131031/6550_1 /ASSEMBLY_ACC=CAM_ASM_000384 /TAXON_ID=2969 /ORGANISM="Oxyrrhis marina" /LENGTH=167 /DNA_ID=CAMNT_0051299517 /DNA_START=25 /DNA_END=528 /DNA_ORIENTATION=-
MPGIDYSKFDNIGDSSDEEEQVKKVEATRRPGPQATPVEPEGDDPTDIAPPLDLDAPDWMEFYKTQLTAPQRMQTLVQMWNTANQDERVASLRKLIDIIDDVKISNRIKGGQEILKDLDPHYYPVHFPRNWKETFSALPVEGKTDVFEKLFKALPKAEQNAVMGSLM